MFVPPAEDVAATTRIDCGNTGGYNVKPGFHGYEYCPFCGHAISKDETHEIVVSLPE